MKCPRCQQDNPSHARFCFGCGARLALACDSCGTELPGGARFCLQCGRAVTAGTAAPVRSPAPETYTPKHLAERILTSKTALEGERKQVTVLFADLKGSMELLADRDPEEARKLLDPVLERMMEAVHRYEGTVNQVMGDGIMALFGAPLAHEDHAVRACYAALRMQEWVARYSEELRRTQAADVQIRVGLNSGEVVVRSIGSDLRMDYTAVGQTTHLAARMEQLARPGTTLVAAATLRLAEGHVQVRTLGPMPVRGLPEPVEVYELTGTGATRSRLQAAAAARGLSRFVGREPEMEQLYRALALAGAGSGQVVAVVGEAGVGKSRLVYEFTRSHRTEGWLTLEASSVSYGRATSYLPVIDLLKAYFAIQDRDDHRAIRDKVIGRVLGLDRALEPTLPVFFALFDLPVEDSLWQALDPPQRRQRTLDAIKHLLLRESRLHPLVLVFEDLHWVDAETQALLDSLVESLPPARLLLLVNYRPEYEHRWSSKTYYTQLRMASLTSDSAEELLQALLGGDLTLQALKRLLIESTEGNPFFLEESVRSLVETRVLTGPSGVYRLARPLETITVPVTVQAVLAARIDRLPSDDKRLLQTAAVVGKDMPFELLSAVAELSEDDLHRGLGRLQAAEFLYETRLFPDLEYTFKHSLTHEVAYGSVLQERRRSLHARIVEAVERLYSARLAEHVERLGHHAARGEVWEKAVDYLRQAGRKAFERSANREAVGWFEQALAALKRLPESRETTELAIDLRFDLRNSLNVLAEFERLLEYLREAEVLAESVGDQRRLGRTLGYLAQALSQRGDHHRAIEAGRRALAIGDTIGDMGISVLANDYLGWAYYRMGDFRRAMEFHAENLKAIKSDVIRERFGLVGLPVVYAKTLHAWSLAELGRFAEGIAHGEEGMRIAETANHPYSQIVAIWGVGYLRFRKGDFEDAIGPLERGLELCHVTQSVAHSHWIAAFLGAAYMGLGRLSEGVPLLERAINMFSTKGLRSGLALYLGLLGEAHLIAGRGEESLKLAFEALDLSRDRAELANRAWALRLLGEIYSQRDRGERVTAEQHYWDALGLADQLGMKPVVAHCQLGLGRLHRRGENWSQATEHITAAATLFSGMDMVFWQKEAEAELTELGWSK